LGGAVGRIEEHEREWGGGYINCIKVKIISLRKTEQIQEEKIEVKNSAKKSRKFDKKCENFAKNF
jgi:hypothetical protein